MKASTICPAHITLQPGEPVTVVCTDCGTWRKLTRSMIPAHRSTDLGRDLIGADGRQVRRDARCPGSGQRITMDLTVARWVTRIEDGLAEVAARRPTKVLRKVKTPAAPALGSPATADTVYVTLSRHRVDCAVCTDEAGCRYGLSLLAAHKRLLTSEQQRAEAASARRAEQWSEVLLPVFVADAQRRIPLHGARSPIQGAAVPVWARPIATSRLAEEVLALSPVRKKTSTA
ncbi:hypothetical protein [Kitasatospora sp. NPDC057223]|uniref:hypothetical protein n=1 Tax=Kitasatospora sp. NPDC057223 TaxID=3346055 RepID=UPI0036334C08